MSGRARPPVVCPICRAPVQADAAVYPFCSERCQIIDLGNWLGESYRVDAGPADRLPENDPDAGGGGGD